MRYLSVCDGIGAVHLAWQPLGWEVSAKGCESNHGRANSGLTARQTVAPAPGAIAARSDRDGRCSPDPELSGRKAGPKNKEVTK
jgi:hypothetical protein